MTGAGATMVVAIVVAIMAGATTDHAQATAHFTQQNMATSVTTPDAQINLITVNIVSAEHHRCQLLFYIHNLK